MVDPIWISHELPGQHDYRGIVMGRSTPRDHLEEVNTMEIFDDDVILSTYPKSGTTFLQEIIWLVLHDADVRAANQTSNLKRVPFIDHCTPGDNRLILANQSPRPRLLKTHLPYHLLPVQVIQKNVKKITIFRNPKDVLVSYYHMYRSTSCFGNFKGTWEQFFEMAMVGNLAWGNVWDHVVDWWARRKDPNVLVLFYEDLLCSHQEGIRMVANFLGKAFSDEEIDKIAEATRFQTMKSNPVISIPTTVDETISPFLRKGTIGDWKNYFTVRQNERFDEMIRDKLKDSGISYTYEM